jgi:hypothetical protein
MSIRNPYRCVCRYKRNGNNQQTCDNYWECRISICSLYFPHITKAHNLFMIYFVMNDCQTSIGLIIDSARFLL